MSCGGGEGAWPYKDAFKVEQMPSSHLTVLVESEFSFIILLPHVYVENQLHCKNSYFLETRNPFSSVPALTLPFLLFVISKWQRGSWGIPGIHLARIPVSHFLFAAFSPVLFYFFVLISSWSIMAGTFALFSLSCEAVILEGEWASDKSCLYPKQLICN